MPMGFCECDNGDMRGDIVRARWSPEAHALVGVEKGEELIRDSQAIFCIHDRLNLIAVMVMMMGLLVMMTTIVDREFCR